MCQITSERFQKSLQRHLSMYVCFHSARVFKYVSDSNLLFFPSHTLPLLQLFFFPLLKSFLSSFSVILSLSVCLLPTFVVFLAPSADDATRVILKSTDDYINANYINVSVFLLVFHLSVNISVPCGWSVLLTLQTHVETLWWPHW